MIDSTQSFIVKEKKTIENYQNKWRNVAVSTERLDQSKATYAVQELYALCGLAKPKVLFCASPYEAMFQTLPQIENLEPVSKGVANLWSNIVKFGSGKPKIDRDKLTHERLDDVNTHIHQTTYFKFISYMKDVARQTKVDIADELELQINVNISELYHQLQTQLGKQYDHNFISAATFCSYCVWLDFWQSTLNYSIDSNLFQVFGLIAESCGWIFTYQEVVVVCDRPTKLCFDEQNRLHAEGEPAIEFSDGYRLYAYHGVALPEKYGKLHPKQWQSQLVLEEKNAELRRVLMQGIGYTRISQELQATELDSYQEYTLLKIDDNLDLEPIYLLKMICPSTDMIHVLRVPPHIKSAQEAITWVNWGITPEEFAVQT